MANENKYEGMPLAEVVQQWLDGNEWKDEIEINEDRTFSRMTTIFGIGEDGQPHDLFVETEEDTLRISVYLYTPYKCPPSRMDAMARILNRLNNSIPIGRLACADDDEANRVQYRASIDFDGSQASPEQVGVMVDAAARCFRNCGSLLAAVALTKRPAEELWEEAAKEDEAERAAQEAEEGPSQL